MKGRFGDPKLNGYLLVVSPKDMPRKPRKGAPSMAQKAYAMRRHHVRAAIDPNVNANPEQQRSTSRAVLASIRAFYENRTRGSRSSEEDADFAMEVLNEAIALGRLDVAIARAWNLALVLGSISVQHVGAATDEAANGQRRRQVRAATERPANAAAWKMYRDLLPQVGDDQARSQALAANPGATRDALRQRIHRNQT